MWRDTCAVVREALAAANLSGDAIDSIACTGHGNGLYLIDADGQPVRHAINSTDQRAADIVRTWRADGLDARVLPLTAQSLWAAQPNALLAWLQAYEPQSFARASHLLMAKDYIRFRLTGVVAMEETDMSATSLMHVPDGTYDDRLLAWFGIPDAKRLLPPLVKSAEICGTVTPAAAAATGLRTGTPVAGGCSTLTPAALRRAVLTNSSLWWRHVGQHQYIDHQPDRPRPVHDFTLLHPGWFLMLEGIQRVAMAGLCASSSATPNILTRPTAASSHGRTAPAAR